MNYIQYRQLLNVKTATDQNFIWIFLSRCPKLFIFFLQTLIFSCRETLSQIRHNGRACPQPSPWAKLPSQLLVKGNPRHTVYFKKHRSTPAWLLLSLNISVAQHEALSRKMNFSDSRFFLKKILCFVWQISMYLQYKNRKKSIHLRKYHMHFSTYPL